MPPGAAALPLFGGGVSPGLFGIWMPAGFCCAPALAGGSTMLFTGQPLAQPGQTVTYNVPALAAGTYTFICIVHPNMTGTLTVK